MKEVLFMKNKLLNILSLTCNAIIVGLVIYAVSTFFTIGGKGNMEVLGFKCFRYFTVLSNVLVAITSFIFLIFNIKNIKKGIKNIPFNVTLLKLIGTTAVMVTFLTVIFFLGPRLGYKAMFEGTNFILHGVAPLLAIISFVLFELNKKIKIKDSIYGLLPTIIYSIFYGRNVLITKYWEDFYGFTFNGSLILSIISIIVMLLSTLLFSYILVKSHNFMYKKMES